MAIGGGRDVRPSGIRGGEGCKTVGEKGWRRGSSIYHKDWNTRKLSAVLPWTFSGGGGGVRWMFANLDLEAHKASLRKDDIECKPLKRSGGSFDNTLAALC